VSVGVVCVCVRLARGAANRWDDVFEAGVDRGGEGGRPPSGLPIRLREVVSPCRRPAARIAHSLHRRPAPALPALLSPDRRCKLAFQLFKLVHHNLQTSNHATTSHCDTTSAHISEGENVSVCVLRRSERERERESEVGKCFASHINLP
jgi:hypothetical protein